MAENTNFLLVLPWNFLPNWHLDIILKGGNRSPWQCSAWEGGWGERKWTGKGCGAQPAQFLLHHLPHPMYLMGVPSSYWKTTDPCGLYLKCLTPHGGHAMALLQPWALSLYFHDMVWDLLYLQVVKTYAFFKIANGKPYSVILSTEDEPRLSTEVMVQRLRGRSHRIWLQIQFTMGVTLGKLWNVFFFSELPRSFYF